MHDSQNSQKSSGKKIGDFIDEVIDSTQRYGRLKEAVSQSKEKVEIVAGLATALEGTLQNYSLTIWNYRLLTLVFEQRSKENLKAISQNLFDFLSQRMKDQSKIHEINTATYTKMNQEMSHMNEVIQGINQDLTAEINEYERHWLDKIDFVMHIITIPDLAKELKDLDDLMSCIEEIKSFFEKCKDLQDVEEMIPLRDDWNKIKVRFDQYKQIESYEGIKQMYDFSEETISVIRGLLEGNELSLSSISPEVLEDLYKFKDFCRVVALKFKPIGRHENEV